MKKEQVSFNYEGKKIGGFIYRPEEERKFPAVILVHGFGGGVHEEKNKFMCEKLVENGFVAFMFDFYDKPNRLSELPIEEMTVSLQLKVLRKAIDFVSGLDFVNEDKIGLTGHSLGGLTVILYTPTDDRIKALVIQSTVIDFTKTNKYLGISSKWEEQGYWLFEKSWGGAKISYSFVEDVVKHNVLNEAEKIKIPTLVFHGDEDAGVPLEQPQELIKHLKPTDKLVVIK